jgi:hypothetical protein
MSERKITIWVGFCGAIFDEVGRLALFFWLRGAITQIFADRQMNNPGSEFALIN